MSRAKMNIFEKISKFSSELCIIAQNIRIFLFCQLPSPVPRPLKLRRGRAAKLNILYLLYHIYSEKATIKRLQF